MNAVLTGQGWEGVPEATRKQADTAWFRSVLQWDPEPVIKKVDQPLLIMHGELDRQVPLQIAEYASLSEEKVSPLVATQIADWLKQVTVR
jgi:pimeloyl-ACP methyl ester carboxylesterase